MRKSYSEMMQYATYNSRLLYLQQAAKVGDLTFGNMRYANQALYRSYEWKQVRRQVILRDNACDLAVPELEIPSYVIIHHINPLTLQEIEEKADSIFDLDNLVCVSHRTHNLIHYGIVDTSENLSFERTPGDTILWR